MHYLYSVKFFCLLLSLYVILLSAKPCCADKDCLASPKQNTTKTTPTEKECAGCSPFFSCGSCAGFVVNKQFSVALNCSFKKHTAEYPAYQQPSIVKMARSIWLPPKLS